MQCIFKNPTTGKLEVGFISKKSYTSKGRRWNVINEAGNVYNLLPCETDAPDAPGYVDLKLTEDLKSYVTTNLNLNNQGNYLDKKYIPHLKKVSV